MDQCPDHTGCIERIGGLERTNEAQWGELRDHRARMDSILTRINVILGGVVVAVIMLLVNIVVK